MTSVLDVLFLRRPVIEYVSPAICEVDFSSSGGPIIVLDPLSRLLGPTGLVLGADGHTHRLSWNNYPGALCYSVYKLVDELDPFGPYQLIAECITDNFIDLDDPGHYRITVITPDGESPFSDPFDVVFPSPPVPPVDVTIAPVDGMYVALDLSEEAVVCGFTAISQPAYWKAGILTTLPAFSDGTGELHVANGNLVGGRGDNTPTTDGLLAVIGGSQTNIGAELDIFGLNILGQAAIQSAHGPASSYRYSGGVVTNLGTLGGETVLGGNAPLSSTPVNNRNINATGLIVCSSQDSSGSPRYHPCFWNLGVLSDVTPPFVQANHDSWFNAINASGHAIGGCSLAGGDIHGFFYNGAGSTEFQVGPRGTFPYSLNDNDQVCGSYYYAPSFVAPFWWEAGTASVIDVEEVVPGFVISEALAINNDGWVVGYAADNFQSFAFLYKVNSDELVLLADLLPDGSDWDSLEEARFINNNKQIVGQGTYLGTPGVVFLMTLP